MPLHLHDRSAAKYGQKQQAFVGAFRTAHCLLLKIILLIMMCIASPAGDLSCTYNRVYCRI